MAQILRNLWADCGTAALIELLAEAWAASETERGLATMREELVWSRGG